eukprot:gene15075-17847_t
MSAKHKKAANQKLRQHTLNKAAVRKRKTYVPSARGTKGELEDVDDISLKEYRQSEINTLKRLRDHVLKDADQHDHYDILADDNNIAPTVFAYSNDDIASLEILGPEQQHLNTHQVKRSKRTIEEENAAAEAADELARSNSINKLSKKEKAKKKLQRKLTEAKSIQFMDLPPIKKKFWRDTANMSPEALRDIRVKNKIKIDALITTAKLDKQTPEEIPRPITSFEDTDLPKSMLKYLDFLKTKHTAMREPTPVQTQSWSAVLNGADVLTIAQTGSGKTLGYLLPAIPHVLEVMRQRKRAAHAVSGVRGPIALVIVPTRELAQQVEAVCRPMRAKFGIHAVAIYGGVKSAGQKDILAEEHTEIMIATPGRLVDLIERSAEVVGLLGRVSMLVLDEADRMLQLGFGDQLHKISEQIRGDRQTLMFSATFPKAMQEAASKWLCNPLRIRVKSSSANEENTAIVSKNVRQVVKVIDEKDRQDYLNKFLASIIEKEALLRNRSLILIFVNQIKNIKAIVAGIDKVMSAQKKRKYKVSSIHGDMKQIERDQVVTDFKAGKVNVLVASDILGRGIHINNLRFVVNYDFPTSLEQYIHRVGRTGRQGNKGHALTLYCNTPQNTPMTRGLIRILEECGQTVSPDLVALADSYTGPLAEMPKLHKETEEDEDDDKEDEDDEFDFEAQDDETEEPAFEDEEDEEDEDDEEVEDEDEEEEGDDEDEDESQ